MWKLIGARPFAINFTAMAGVWLVLTEANPDSMWIGIPSVTAAAWYLSKSANSREVRISLTGLLRFTLFFLWESLRGGLDVAKRTLSPRLAINPDFKKFRTCLRITGARTLFANSVCLLPGTLVAAIDDDQLWIHVLDKEADPEVDLRRLERAVKWVYPTAANR